MPELDIYIPQKPTKNWLGIRMQPTASDLQFVEAELKKQYPHLIRIDRPQANISTNEDYHVTLVYDILPEKLDEAIHAVKQEKLTDKDLKIKRDPTTGHPAMTLLLSQNKTTVFGLLE